MIEKKGQIDTCEGVIDFIDKSIAYNEQPQKGNV